MNGLCITVEHPTAEAHYFTETNLSVIWKSILVKTIYPLDVKLGKTPFTKNTFEISQHQFTSSLIDIISLNIQDENQTIKCCCPNFSLT